MPAESPLPPGAPGPAAPSPVARAAVGSVVHVDPAHFAALLSRGREAVVLHQPAGFLHPHRYLAGYRGLHLLTASRAPIDLPRWAEVIEVRHLRMPA